MKKQRRKTREALIYSAAKEKKARRFLDVKLLKEKMWVYYVLQSLLATIIVFIVLLVFINSPVIVAALGASAFIVFAMPKNVTAQPRNVVGGHLVGVISGGLCALFLIFFNLDSGFTLVTAASISVGLTIFIMVVIDTEHPPGCSTALGLVVHASDLGQVAYYAAFILISAIILSGVKHGLSPRLKDLV